MGEDMATTDLLTRIESNPDVMVGKTVIKGTRLTVEYILGQLAQGATTKELLDEYEGLTHDDIRACLLFASKTLEQSSVLPLVVEPS